MSWRKGRVRVSGPMDLTTLLMMLPIILLAYAAWLTSIVTCATNGPRALLITDAIVFPVGIVHGLVVWLSAL